MNQLEVEGDNEEAMDFISTEDVEMMLQPDESVGLQLIQDYSSDVDSCMDDASDEQMIGTSKRTINVGSIDHQLAIIGLYRKKTTGNGNCRPCALLDQLYGNENEQENIRKLMVTELENNPERYQPFIPQHQTFAEKLAELSKDKNPIDEFGLVAFAESQKVKVWIHQFGLCPKEVNPVEVQKNLPELHLAYTGDGHNGHFESVRRLGDYSFDPANVYMLQCETSKAQTIKKPPKLVSVLHESKELNIDPNNELQCGACGWISQTPRQYRQHIYGSHNVEIVQVDTGDVKSNYEFKIVSGDKPSAPSNLFCRYCNRKFNDTQQKKRHESHLCILINDPCPHCGKILSDLKGHLRTCKEAKKRGLDSNYPEESRTCMDCGFIVTTKQNLRNHQRNCRKKIDSFERHWSCRFCRKVFKESVPVEHHLEQCHIFLKTTNAKTLKPFCGSTEKEVIESQDSTSEAISHTTIETRKRKILEPLESTGLDNVSTDFKKNGISDDKPSEFCWILEVGNGFKKLITICDDHLWCGLCKTSFVTKQSLRRHVYEFHNVESQQTGTVHGSNSKIVSGDKSPTSSNLFCRYCNRKFNDTQQKNRHESHLCILINDPCPHCGKILSDLKGHLRTCKEAKKRGLDLNHSEESRTCMDCGFIVTNKENFRKHQKNCTKIHKFHGNWSCKFCRKIFKASVPVQDHLKQCNLFLKRTNDEKTLHFSFGSTEKAVIKSQKSIPVSLQISDPTDNDNIKSKELEPSEIIGIANVSIKYETKKIPDNLPSEFCWNLEASEESVSVSCDNMLCGLCKTSFDTKKSLRRHVHQFHYVELYQTDTMEGSENNNGKIKLVWGDKPQPISNLDCQYCSKKFKDIQQRKRHEKDLCLLVKDPCPHCGKTTTKFEKHLRTCKEARKRGLDLNCSEESRTCKDCEFVVTNNNNMAKHQKNCTKIHKFYGKWSCRFCHQVFKESVPVDHHLKLCDLFLKAKTSQIVQFYSDKSKKQDDESQESISHPDFHLQNIKQLNLMSDERMTGTSDQLNDVESLDQQLAMLGLYRKVTTDNGNCMPCALSDQIYGNETEQGNIRSLMVAELERNSERYQPFIPQHQTFAEKLAELATDKNPMDQFGLVAFVQSEKVKVYIHRLSLTPSQIKPFNLRGKNLQELHLTYTGDGHNGHYESVRRLGDNSVDPANVYMSQCEIYLKQTIANEIPENERSEFRWILETDNESISVCKNSLQCGLCEIRFITKQYLRQHVYEFHNVELRQTDTLDGRTNNNDVIKIVSGKKLRAPSSLHCRYCSTQFTNIRLRQKHEATLCILVNEPCPYCKKTFADTYKHLRVCEEAKKRVFSFPRSIQKSTGIQNADSKLYDSITKYLNSTKKQGLQLLPVVEGQQMEGETLRIFQKLKSIHSGILKETPKNDLDIETKYKPTSYHYTQMVAFRPEFKGQTLEEFICKNWDDPNTSIYHFHDTSVKRGPCPTYHSVKELSEMVKHLKDGLAVYVKRHKFSRGATNRNSEQALSRYRAGQMWAEFRKLFLPDERKMQIIPDNKQITKKPGWDGEIDEDLFEKAFVEAMQNLPLLFDDEGKWVPWSINFD